MVWYTSRRPQTATAETGQVSFPDVPKYKISSAHKGPMGLNETYRDFSQEKD
jgi:hypothetical protein